MLQLQWIAEGGSQAGRAGARRRATQEPREARVGRRGGRCCSPRRGARRCGFIRRAPKPLRVVRFEVANPPAITTIDAPKISPDGKMLAFNATDSGGKTQIWLRPLNALTAQPAARNRGNAPPLLVPRQSLSGVHRGRQAQEDRRHRRSAHQDLRRADRSRRKLEPRGRHPLRRHGHRSDLPGPAPRAERRSSP